MSGQGDSTESGPVGVMSAIERDEAEFLRRYDASAYEKPAFTVDLVLFTVRDEHLHALLVQRAEHPFKGCWALPGGFLDPRRDDSVDACAARKLVEETGVRAPYLEQTGPDVQVLAAVNGKAVIARQGKILTTSFHPELTDDDRIHRYFLQMICEEN